MLKRNRAFIVKILCFFLAYYFLTITISNNAQEGLEQESEGTTEEGEELDLDPEQRNFIENK